jgi:methylenetetrahydrofolate--tRNA-(uracil-5-)-methyltransferase
MAFVALLRTKALNMRIATKTRFGTHNREYLGKIQIMNQKIPDIIIVGGGVAGSEAAYQAASRGIKVWLYEMRPRVQTGAHHTGDLGELVCSNSLGSKLPDRASGLIKDELRTLDSFIIRCADQAALPAGDSLAVDRGIFSKIITETLESMPNIRVVRAEVEEIPNSLSIIASGPLTSPSLSKRLQELTGREHLFFYDAIAPIVHRDSIDMDIAFRASRFDYDQDAPGDYINCPFTQEEYLQFVEALSSAERVALRGFETELEAGVRAGYQGYFEACLPVEIIARRGIESLAFGPMRPIGLRDPRTGRRPYAVIQLRQDNLAGDFYNLVGFQTNMLISEQERIFRMVPGLKNCEFLRYGQMHRNTYLYSPVLLKPNLQSIHRDNLFFAGQITGVEGYAGNIATGLLAGINAVRYFNGKPLWELPKTTMIGALSHYVTHANPCDFQPMKANMGLLPHLEDPPKKGRGGRRERARLLAVRARADLESFLKTAA